MKNDKIFLLKFLMKKSLGVKLKKSLKTPKENKNNTMKHEGFVLLVFRFKAIKKRF